MDPYIQNVIDRSKLEANRNYTENILPQLDAKFTSAGQYGSSAMAREANRAARELTEGLQTNANAALSGAYTNAANIFGQDQSRQLGLAQLAGQLGTADQQAKLAAGKQLGDLGASQQNLGLQGAAALDTIGQKQQQQNQSNLDLAYQDFTNQRDYGKNTIDWLSSVIRGMPAPVSQTSTTTGPGATYQPSPLRQLGGGLADLAGLLEAFKKE
jgi:hypothetical protein